VESVAGAFSSMPSPVSAGRALFRRLSSMTIRRITNNLRRRAMTWATAGLAVTGVAGALSLTAASAAPVTSARHSGAFTFGLVPSPGIKSCLPHAGGRVTIIPGSQNDTMKVSIFGMPRNAEFDLFVIQTPNKPLPCPGTRPT
jgi:hypothetical protein